MVMAIWVQTSKWLEDLMLNEVQEMQNQHEEVITSCFLWKSWLYCDEKLKIMPFLLTGSILDHNGGQ